MNANRLGILALALVVAAAGVVMGFGARRGLQQMAAPPDGLPVVRPADLPPLYPVPAFTLTDARGEAVSLDSLRGKVWVAMFFFTSCAGPCPVMVRHMADLAADISSALPVRFVSITVDPETDTPERLKTYGEGVGADFGRWHFLTGPMDTIAPLAHEGFKLGSVDEPVFHSDRFVLVDGAGSIRGYFTGTDPEAMLRLRGAIDTLLKDSPR
jgi:protein SCO1/2